MGSLHVIIFLIHFNCVQMNTGKSEVLMSDARSDLDNWLKTVIMLRTDGLTGTVISCCYFYQSTTMKSKANFMFFIRFWMPY